MELNLIDNTEITLPDLTDIRIRRAVRDDFPALFELNVRAFGQEFPDYVRAVAATLFAPDRVLVVDVRQGPEWVLAGKIETYSLRLSLPGGNTLPAAGLTWVAVAPEHRGRGLFTMLLQRHLADLHQQWHEPVGSAGGEAVSILYSKKPTAYRRFGYGLATRHLHMRIPPDAVLSEAVHDPALRCREGTAAQLWEPAEQLYAQLVPSRPGMLVRPGALSALAVPEAPGTASDSVIRCLLIDDSQKTRAFARYRMETGHNGGSAPGGMTVLETHAADPAAALALWRHLLGHGREATVCTLPMDDPLLHFLADPRTPQPTIVDGLHLRLVDVGRALAARGYRTGIDLVLDVTDSTCPWNTGRWRLSGGPTDAICHRTSAPVDLSLSAADLGALYLGGTSAEELLGAGRVREHRRGAAAVAGIAFSSPVSPWCSFHF
ncbi:UPF0256 protein [Longimycelium tulufanense]|uniref:UPF0256 protein n=2 Tax=Longimycelium tulufanense TaxID=907463 RepID=A0A8J3C7D6_9PSEU|nr:UPF0256 protein [Longimycelium tulufanense]